MIQLSIFNKARLMTPPYKPLLFDRFWIALIAAAMLTLGLIGILSFNLTFNASSDERTFMLDTEQELQQTIWHRLQSEVVRKRQFSKVNPNTIDNSQKLSPVEEIGETTLTQASQDVTVNDSVGLSGHTAEKTSNVSTPAVPTSTVPTSTKVTLEGLDHENEGLKRSDPEKNEEMARSSSDMETAHLNDNIFNLDQMNSIFDDPPLPQIAENSGIPPKSAESQVPTSAETPGKPGKKPFSLHDIEWDLSDVMTAHVPV